MIEGARSINWLEAAAWAALTLLLITLMGSAVRHIWTAALVRVRELEKWREHHQEAHQTLEMEIKLQLRDLQNESKNHTSILEKLGEQLRDLAEMAGIRRRKMSWPADPRVTNGST